MQQNTVAPRKGGPIEAATVATAVARFSLAAGALTVTPDADQYGVYKITATVTTAWDLANPTGSPQDGQRLTLILVNSSGGVMGTCTLGNKYKAAVIKPATGYVQTVDLIYDGVSALWRQMNVAADVAV